MTLNLMYFLVGESIKINKVSDTYFPLIHLKAIEQNLHCKQIYDVLWIKSCSRNISSAIYVRQIHFHSPP